MDFDRKYSLRIKEFYIPFFEDARNVLDLGCGMGDFLQLLKNKGINGYGVDSDSRMVKYCRRQGYKAVKKDAMSFLRETRLRFDGILCSHVLEHMSAKDSLALLRMCRKVLTNKGVIVVSTPNPSSLPTQLHEFWRDPTHVRMYAPELLTFLLHFSGYRVIDSGVNPNYYFILPFDERTFKPIKSTPEVRAGKVSPHSAELEDVRSRMGRLEQKVNRIAADVSQVLKNLYQSGEIYSVGQKSLRSN
jgi:SAM-dependent methyltransferase